MSTTTVVTATQRFADLEKLHNENIAAFKAAPADAETLVKDLDARYATLEFPVKDAKVPEKAELEAEKTTFKTRFDALKALQAKVDDVFKTMSAALAELKITDAQKLEITNTIALGYKFYPGEGAQKLDIDFQAHFTNFATLDKNCKEVADLKGKLVVAMPKAEYSLGCFLSIVANDGKPLSNFSRLSNALAGVSLEEKKAPIVEVKPVAAEKKEEKPVEQQSSTGSFWNLFSSKPEEVKK